MEWQRVKSILIGVFLVVNIFLIMSYMGGVKTGVTIDNQTALNAIAVLEKNNVSIDEKLIPRRTDDIRMFDAVNQFESPKAVAEFAYQNAQKLNLDYFNPQNVVLADTTFQYIAPIGEKIKGLEKLDENSAKKYAEGEMKKLGLCLSARCESSVNQKDDSFVVKISPVYEGKRILDSNIYVEVGNTGIKKIFGQNWLCDNITDGGITNVIPVTEILINFATNPLRDKTGAVQITKLDIGYFLGNRGGEKRTVTAVPVWRIITNEGKSYYFDSRNGDLL